MKHHDAEQYARYALLAELKYERVRDAWESWWQHYFMLKNRGLRR